MSTAPDDFDPDEVLSGQWTDVSLVTDVGTAEETETFLVQTTSDITVSKDSNETAWEPNSSRYEQSQELHVRREIEVPLYHDADTDLEEAGVFDDNDVEVFNEVHDAVRLHIHKEREDDTHVLEREAERCRVQLGDEEFPSDAAQATLTFVVMGEYRKAFSTV